MSVVAIPATLILAFLGINASQVSSNQSMFSHHYLGMYLAVVALIVVGSLLSLALWVQQRRAASPVNVRPRGPRRTWVVWGRWGLYCRS